MFKNKLSLAALLAYSVMSAPVMAEDNFKAGFLLEGGLHAGGDKVATIFYVDGDSASVKAGQLFQFSVGASLDYKRVETRLKAGYKFDKANASNGSFTWDRFPLEALVLYKAGNVRVGGGLAYHLNPKLKASGAASGLNVDYNDALGAVVEVDYMMGGFYIGGVANIIEYDEDTYGTKLDANSLGVNFGYVF